MNLNTHSNYTLSWQPMPVKGIFVFIGRQAEGDRFTRLI
jgi:hypothetical protein